MLPFEPWREKAKCRNDPALQEWIMDPANKGRDFFHDREFEQQAIRYCQGCPVSLECLAVANASLVTEDDTTYKFPKYQGVMGGTSLRQRRRFRKKAQKRAAELRKKFGLPPNIAA